MFALLRKPLSLILLGFPFFLIQPDALNLTPPPGRMSALPRRTLWVWERPEDVSGVDPRTTAIAVLESTILLDRTAIVVPRRQFYIYPTGMVRIAVVRIESAGPIAPGLEQTTADLILESIEDSPVGSVAALQVDFDARRSEWPFYTAVLRELRRRMPPDLPLSITALASWCSYDDWLGGLPVDEAVPMFFRMEPDRRYAPVDLPQFKIREPLCMGSVGVSTREPRGVSTAGKRVYIFPDRGWREDLPLLAQSSFQLQSSPKARIKP